MDLTVVTATRGRPKQLATCLAQFRSQTHNLRVEQIVVFDGEEPDEASIKLCSRSGARWLHNTKNPGGCGAAAKDLGIGDAAGQFSAIFDDDNLWRPEALAVLYASVYGVDLGICQCLHHGPLEPLRSARMVRIPPVWRGGPTFGEIDTMCLCVRTAVARTVPWDDGDQSRGTDYRWVRRLVAAGAQTRFLPVVIGEKL